VPSCPRAASVAPHQIRKHSLWQLAWHTCATDCDARSRDDLHPQRAAQALARRDRAPHLDQRVQLLVSTDSQLQVARRDTLHLCAGVPDRSVNIWPLTWPAVGARPSTTRAPGRARPAPSGPWMRCRPAPAPRRSGTLRIRHSSGQATGSAARRCAPHAQAARPARHEPQQHGPGLPGRGKPTTRPARASAPRMAAVYTAAVAPTRPLAVTRPWWAPRPGVRTRMQWPCSQRSS